jgi:superfamily I DNA and RNA helicase
MAIAESVRRDLNSAIRGAEIRILGQDLLKNDSEAVVLAAIVRGFGNSPAGFIYASPSRARTTRKPPDVVLCHPDVGLLVIETKGIDIGRIEGVEAGSIMFRYNGHVQPTNVIRQVEDQMYDILDDIQRLIRRTQEIPLLNCMAAFPRISEAEWCSREYDKVHPLSQLLLKDQISDEAKLRQRVHELVKKSLEVSRKPIPLDLCQVEVIQKVFGNSDVIASARPYRAEVSKVSLGAVIDERLNQEKYLSEEQKALSRIEFEGSQRLIRGVAGSGKSVVLANLVARHLHRDLESLQRPLWDDRHPRVAVTCFNRALVEFLRRKIRTAYREQTLNEEIPEDILKVTHFNGLLYYIIHEQGWPLDYISINEVRDGTERAMQYRHRIEMWAREDPKGYQDRCFDTIFVDEGQDFEPEEFRLLLDLIKPNPKSGERPIVIFYDDAQNLYGRTRPVWRDVGINVVGERAQVLKECFRNTRQIVELALNVLLGSSASPDMRALTRTFADIAYLKDRSLVEEDGNCVRVRFAEREGEPPHVAAFDDELAEMQWIVRQVSHLVHDEGVRLEDILVIFYRPTAYNHPRLESLLAASLPGLQFVRPHGDNFGDKDCYIFQPGKMTVSTVYGSKGYDAPVVFLVGADRFGTDTEGRAAFYVAATRAMEFLYITGVQGRASLLTEAGEIREKLWRPGRTAQ